MPALDEVLAAVAAAMHESSARWYLFGAQAATLWGRPRLTADVDITAEIRLEPLDKFLEAMKRQGFTMRFDDRDLVNRTRVVPFLHDRTGLPLDVVLAGPGLEEEFLDRAVNVQVEGTTVPVLRSAAIAAEGTRASAGIGGRPFLHRDDARAVESFP